MTPEHLLFIPAVFLIGFASGVTLPAYAARFRKNGAMPPNPTHKTSLQWASGRVVLIALLAFFVMFLATHHFEIPYSKVSIEEITGGLPLFDQSPSFSSDEVYERLSEFGHEASEVYKRFTYTTDVVFPLSMLILLTTFAAYVIEKAQLNSRFRYYIMLVPAIWFVSDMIENLMVFTLLAQYPRPANVIGGMVGYVTVLKFALLLTSALLPVVVFGASRKRT